MAKLGELYAITSGGTPSRKHPEYYENGSISWVKTGDLKNIYLSVTDEKITVDGLKNSSARLYPVGTVLLAMYGATIGATSILKIEAATNQACAAFTPRADVIPQYLCLFFESQKSRFIKDAVGGAQPNISAGYLRKIEIPLPNLDEQRKIAAVLDKVSDLIAKRRQQLDKLDLLVKARFVEMFGDPVSNPHQWKKVPLSNLADVRIGPFGSLLHKEDYIVGGHPLVNPSHIVDDKIVVDEKLSVSEQKYAELEPYHLKIGDVVMGRRGEMGRCAVVQYKGLLCGTGSLIIRTNGDVTADYIQKIISFPSFKKTIEDMAVGQTMPNLNVPIVSNFQIIKPPLEIQEGYYTFVNQTEKTKITISRSLQKLEMLKKALMQEYFG